MRQPTLGMGLAALAAINLACGTRAETKAELVSSTMIWDKAPRCAAADLTRFKDRWWLVCCESTDPNQRDSALRILMSTEGVQWESAAIIQSPTPGRGLTQPKFSIAPDGRLMVTALGVVPTPNVPDPLPANGGTVRTMAWSSVDGRTWGTTDFIGEMNYPFSRLAWHKGTAFTCASGCICGSFQTVRIYSGGDGKGFKPVYEQTFHGFFPEEADLIFEGDTAYCVLSRVDSGIGNAKIAGFLGMAKAPFTDWRWNEMDTPFRNPNLLQLPGKRVIGTVSLFAPKPRTTLCEFDLASGKVKELVSLPTAGLTMDTGLAWHEGHVWVSYHALHQGRLCIHLAKIKLME